MKRITEMHIPIAIVTIVTWRRNKYTTDFDAWTQESKVNVVLMRLRLRKYIKLREN